MSHSWAVESLVDRADGVDCDINIGGTGLSVIWVMVSLALATVGTRLYTQARITKQLGLSDWLMLVSMTIITAFAALISVQYHFGWGRHQACITDLVKLETQIKFNVASQSFGIMGSTFGRMSFIVFMVVLFGSRTWVRWTLWVMFVAQIITNLGTVIAIYAQCKDPRALYIFTLSDAQCWPSYVQTYLGWAHTSFNGVCDLFLSILPAAMVWNLHMATRLKIGVAILLGMSALALVGLVMKCVYLNALSYTGDYSYNTVPMFTWIIVEGTLVAIAASAPFLRPLFRHSFPTTRGTNDPRSYDLPRYAVQTDSSGFSKLGSKVRTSVRAGPAPRYPGLTALDGGSSEEDIALVLQQQRHSQSWPEMTPQTRGIVVKQEYTVTSEAKGEGWEKTHGAEAGVARGGEVHQGRPRSEPSLTSDGELAHSPVSAWSRDKS